MDKRRNRRGLSGNKLKVIAMTAMFLDHVGAVVIEPSFCELWTSEITRGDLTFYVINRGLRAVGRIAFPIYCFLLLQGFLHTSNAKKYLFRLGLFAFISEIPFDLAIAGKWACFDQQNIFFTLSASLLMLCLLRQFPERPWVSLFTLAGTCALTWLARCDYGAVGPLMIGFMYYYREDRTMFYLTGMITAGMESARGFLCGILAYIPISLYNGERGKTQMKWFSYCFYPLHLCLLAIVRLVIKL